MDELTKLLNLIDPEVMADMISATLPDALRFSPLSTIDDTLEGQPGSTLTVPKFKYIGDAEDVAEGEAIPYAKLETDSETFTIKKAGRGVKITDEALLSGLGNPIGEGEKQILMAIANKVDNDHLEALRKAVFKSNSDYWNIETVDAAEDMFDDEDDSDKVLIMNNKDAAVLRKALGQDFERPTDLGDDIIINGTYGRVLGSQIVRTRKLKRGEAYLVKPGALKMFRKRGVLAEKERDIDHKLTKMNADQHYGVYLYDDSKAVKITVKNPTETGTETEPEEIQSRVNQAVASAMGSIETDTVEEKEVKKETKEKDTK